MRSEIVRVFEPRKSTDPIRTISELADWMNYERANSSGGYGIGQAAHDGFEIDREGQAWHWRFNERGSSRTIQTFESEEEIVSFAYGQIRNDPWAWTHCIGWFRIEKEAVTLTEILKERGFPFYSDQIPYGGIDDPRYRIFVFGRDSLGFKVLDSRECS